MLYILGKRKIKVGGKNPREELRKEVELNLNFERQPFVLDFHTQFLVSGAVFRAYSYTLKIKASLGYRFYSYLFAILGEFGALLTCPYLVSRRTGF